MDFCNPQLTNPVIFTLSMENNFAFRPLFTISANGTIQVYKGNSIYVGNNVTSTKPTGDVNIQNSHITIQGKHLELRPRTRIDKNFKFQNR